MPKVSVIIPVYNCENYIREAIDSVLAQTYKEFELIVIDDGSTDNSGRIVREEFGRAATYYYQENGGVAKARNAGIRRSRGEYIAFLDADDVWTPEKLAAQVSILDSMPEVGLVHSDLEFIDSNGRHLKFWKSAHRRDSYARQFLKGHVIATQASLIRRAIIERAGLFDEDFPAAGYEDLEFCIRVGQLGEIYCVERPLVKHRDRLDGMSYNEAIGLGNREIFLGKMISRYGDNKAHKRFLSREYARFCSDLGKWLIQRTERAEGRTKLLKGILMGLRGFDLQIAFRSLVRLLESFI